MKQIYIAWTNYQRRPESMQPFFGYDLKFIYPEELHGIFGTVRRYVRSVEATWQVLVGQRPDVIWFQSPPSLILHIIFLARLLARIETKIVVDVHNSALSKAMWRNMPLVGFLMRRADVVIVHNDYVMSSISSFGVDPGRIHVLNDYPPVIQDEQVRRVLDRPLVTMPGSLSPDEPIEVVLAAARLCPELDFAITGGRHKAAARGLIAAAPSNVTFTPFLPTGQFDELLLRSSAILCLTTEEDVQISAASEAIGVGRPLVISDTLVLRSLFGEAGVFVDNQAASIAAGCRLAIGQYDRYAGQSVALREHVTTAGAWAAQARKVRAAVLDR